MKNIVLKKPVRYTLYGCMFAILFVSLYFLDVSNNNYENANDYTYVSKLFDNESAAQAVNATETETIGKPYAVENVKIVKPYYNYKDDEKKQQESIINYEETYIQNNGISYSGQENFEVVSILGGTVKSIKEDDLLGKVVTIKNNNNITSTYSCLSEVSVNENDTIQKGATIGKSGKCNIAPELEDHLTFELQINGVYVNPDEYYDKNTSDIKQ